MAREGRGEIPGAVKKLRTRLEAYRGKPGRSRRLPEDIWMSAAALARIHGVNCVSRALKLHYGDLKRRAQAGKGTRKTPAEKFVEIGAGIPPWATGCTVELEDQAGRKMAIRLAQPESVELVELTKAFWSASR